MVIITSEHPNLARCKGPVEVFGACTALVDPDPFYVSSILQGSAGPSTAALSRFFAAVPFEAPGLLKAEHEGGVWLFFGHNPPPDDEVRSVFGGSDMACLLKISSRIVMAFPSPFFGLCLVP